MYKTYVSLIKKHVSSDIEILSDDSSLSDCDLLHIIACWDKKASKIANKAKTMGIPYVVTPLGGISRWNMRKPYIQRLFQRAFYQMSIIKNAKAVIAMTSMEMNYLLALRWNTQVYHISNCIFTKTISADKMTKEICDLYNNVYKEFEDANVERIKAQTKIEGNEHDIIAQIMLIHSRMPHKNIPAGYIDDLQTMLHDTEYSDDIIENKLQELKLIHFSRQLFHVMSETTNLTEGFMPLAPLKDRKTRTIKKYIK